jgi:hypothetical protein
VALANNEHVEVFPVPGVPVTRMLGVALFLLSSVISLSPLSLSLCATN